MSIEFEANLEKYAEVILQVGLNLQKGQRLLIGIPAFGIYGTPIELAPLVRRIAKKGYQAGARLVDVIWNDDQIRLERFENAPRDSFEEFPTWRAQAALEAANAGDAVLSFFAEDPELLKAQDPELVGIFNKTNWAEIAPALDLFAKNATNWTVATAPVDGWVDRLFPSLEAGERKARFWELIFDICRVTSSDPIAAWDAHLGGLEETAKHLNNKKYTALKYMAPGTDLLVGLPVGHLWKAGRMTSTNGIAFTANIPTEEVFTLPHKAKVDGVVRSTRPLGYGGDLIEDFTLKFSEGRVVEATARKNEEILLSLLESDDGARRLGEVALVPNSSPISQAGMLFNNILLDENASCHLALGKAYKFNIENGEGLSDEGFETMGGNSSLIHVDFMIGSKDLDVDGLREDGVSEPVMRSGEWAFDR